MLYRNPLDTEIVMEIKECRINWKQYFMGERFLVRENGKLSHMLLKLGEIVIHGSISGVAELFVSFI